MNNDVSILPLEERTRAMLKDLGSYVNAIVVSRGYHQRYVRGMLGVVRPDLQPPPSVHVVTTEADCDRLRGIHFVVDPEVFRNLSLDTAATLHMLSARQVRPIQSSLLPPYQVEKEELDEKIEKLNAFLTDVFKNLNTLGRIMQTYSNILRARIERFNQSGEKHVDASKE